LGAGNFAHQRDEVALDGFERSGVATGRARSFGGAEGGVEFVERADRLDLRAVLGHALTIEEAGRAVIAFAGGDGREGGHDESKVMLAAESDVIRPFGPLSFSRARLTSSRRRGSAS